MNQDVLMARVGRKVEDKRLLKLIRCYLEAGIMADGEGMETSAHSYRESTQARDQAGSGLSVGQ
ncbi:hypothetical protein [Arthrobacter methylotrophus]|uniref:hypothetical protein n=1 Tax=Arthrobacter methylotrophus TaxID=121291 RepID=UPI0031F1BC8A